MKKRTNGSTRKRKHKQERIKRWETSGIHIGSQNVAGISLLKVYMILGTHTLDVLCLQETWLTKSAVTLDIPGYQVFEQRRGTGKRGGIAIIVRNGIKVIRHIGNEFSQGVCLQVHGGEKLWVGNVYMPPTQNL